MSNIKYAINPVNSLNPLNLINVEDLNKLNTGDIILCHGYNHDEPDPGIDGIIEIFTHSPWEHAALIIRDPWGFKPPLSGLYVYQSDDGPNGYPDVLNGNIKGVTLNKLEDFLQNSKYIFIRSLKNVEFDRTNNILFKHLFDITHGKPYDKNICNWVATGIGSFCKCECFSNKVVPEHDNMFWCSALVAYIYERMEWCDKLNWSDKTPADLSKLIVKEPFELTEPWQLK